jgi:hypothetical protein
LTAAGTGPPVRWVITTIVVAGAVVLGGCSSNKQAATSTSAPSTTTTSSLVTTTTPTTTTTVPGCTGANYTVKVLGTEGAAGTNEVTLGLSNTASATCTLFGYPGIQLLGAGGTDIATDEVEGGAESFTDFARTNVSVGPGATAYFNIGYSDVTTGTESSCPTATALQVIPPNTTTRLIVSGRFTVCNAGTVDVSPVFGAGSPETETTAPPA